MRPKKKQPWTCREIAYIQANHGKLTCKMLAQDLKRTEKAVETRIKILRGEGRLSSEKIPTGCRHGTVRMASHHVTEIDALRTEAAAYLTYLVKERGYPANLAILVAKKLKAHLAMPAEYVIPRLNKPVQEWVEELAA